MGRCRHHVHAAMAHQRVALERCCSGSECQLSNRSIDWSTQERQCSRAEMHSCRWRHMALCASPCHGASGHRLIDRPPQQGLGVAPLTATTLRSASDHLDGLRSAEAAAGTSMHDHGPGTGRATYTVATVQACVRRSAQKAENVRVHADSHKDEKSARLRHVSSKVAAGVEVFILLS